MARGLKRGGAINGCSAAGCSSKRSASCQANDSGVSAFRSKCCIRGIARCAGRSAKRSNRKRWTISSARAANGKHSSNVGIQLLSNSINCERADDSECPCGITWRVLAQAARQRHACGRVMVRPRPEYDIQRCGIVEHGREHGPKLCAFALFEGAEQIVALLGDKLARGQEAAHLRMQKVHPA